MRILSVDPSIDPRNFGWALFQDGNLVNSGVAVSGKMAKGQNRYCTIFNFGIGKAVNIDYLVIDWPSMSLYAKQFGRKGRGKNLAGLAINHQAIGAFLAGMQMDMDRVLKWNSAKHKVNKEAVRLAMIAQYRLPADTPDHVTDSIYRGDWLNHQLKSNHFKTIKEIEE